MRLLKRKRVYIKIKLKKIQSKNNIKNNKKKNKKKPSVKIVKDNDVAKMNNNKEEFTYYDKLPPDKLLDLLLSNRIYIDPGKNNLISAVDDNGNEFIYTNRRRLKESNRSRLKESKRLKISETIK